MKYITDDSLRPTVRCREHGLRPAYVYRRQCVSKRTGLPYTYTALNCVICVRLDGRRYSETERGQAVRKAWVAANRKRLAEYQRERYHLQPERYAAHQRRRYHRFHEMEAS